MPGINRTSILTGPALVQYGGQSFWSKGDVTLNFMPTLFGVDTAHFGEMDQRTSDRKFEVSFEPSGAFTAPLAAVLWPYPATAVGASIYGATDRPLVIWTRDGQKLTIYNAAVTEMPTIKLGVSTTIQGSIKFTGLLANNTDPSNAVAYYQLASVAYPGDTGFTVSDIKTPPYTSVWGVSAPWSSFQTEAGWEISFGLELKPQKVDSFGTVDMTLAGLTVMAKAIPVGPTAQDILGKQVPTTVLGNSLATLTDDLIISGPGVYAAVYKAAITASGLVYGSDKKRIGATTWKATRTVASGVAQPLFYISAAAPA